MKSALFIISIGVQLGVILSPNLFFVYMDDLSTILIKSGLGCHIDKTYVNHVFYADDLCIIEPCAIALLELLNICHCYSITVYLNFNALKSIDQLCFDHYIIELT